MWVDYLSSQEVLESPVSLATHDIVQNYEATSVGVSNVITVNSNTDTNEQITFKLPDIGYFAINDKFYLTNYSSCSVHIITSTNYLFTISPLQCYEVVAKNPVNNEWAFVLLNEGVDTLTTIPVSGTIGYSSKLFTKQLQTLVTTNNFTVSTYSGNDLINVRCLGGGYVVLSEPQVQDIGKLITVKNLSDAKVDISVYGIIDNNVALATLKPKESMTLVYVGLKYMKGIPYNLWTLVSKVKVDGKMYVDNVIELPSITDNKYIPLGDNVAYSNIIEFSTSVPVTGEFRYYIDNVIAKVYIVAIDLSANEANKLQAAITIKFGDKVESGNSITLYPTDNKYTGLFQISVNDIGLVSLSRMVLGAIDIASQSDVNAGVVDKKAITPLTLRNYFLANQVLNIYTSGIYAQGGGATKGRELMLNNSLGGGLVTYAGVEVMNRTFFNSMPQSTDTTAGIIQQATQTEVLGGSVNGKSVSPNNFSDSNLVTSDSQIGLNRFATDDDITNSNASSLIVPGNKFPQTTIYSKTLYLKPVTYVFPGNNTFSLDETNGQFSMAFALPSEIPNAGVNFIMSVKQMTFKTVPPTLPLSGYAVQNTHVIGLWGNIMWVYGVILGTYPLPHNYIPDVCTVYFFYEA